MATRTVLVALSICALLPAAGAQAATTVGQTANEPTLDCAYVATRGGPCTAAGASSPVNGIVTKWRLGYSGASDGDVVTFKTFRAAGEVSYTVIRSTSGVAVPAGVGVLEVAGNTPIAAGELIGAYVSNPAMKFITTTGSLAVADGNQPEGETTEYALWSTTAQIAAVVEADRDRDGLGDETQDPTPPADPSDPGEPSNPGEPSDPGRGDPLACPSARPATVAVGRLPVAAEHASRLARPSARVAARQWRRSVIDDPDGARDYRDGRIEFDGRGRRHVAGHIVNPDQVKYFGPVGGEKVIDRTEFSSAIGLGLLPSGTPIVGYERDTECDQYRLAVGPAFTPRLFSYELSIEGSFQFSDLAGDPRRNVAHVAYTVGNSYRLTYRPTDGAAETLPMKHVRRIRVAAVGRRVALAASDRNDTLKVFVRSGGRWRGTTVTKRLDRSWDMDLGSDGRPRVAYTVAGDLRLFNTGWPARIGLDADEVAVAMGRKNSFNLAFTSDDRKQHCVVGGREELMHQACAGKGMHYLQLTKRDLRYRLIQKAIGESMPMSLAVHGKKAEVVFPESGRLVSRRSR